jgi:predicted SprT family Zn-dependent metalloprotease
VNKPFDDYKALQSAFDFFNKALFKDALPPVMLTLQDQKSAGFFSPDRFNSRDDEIASEISLNPQLMLRRSMDDVLGTLVHEMVHLWQHVMGKPSRSGYHNREWADKMIEVGLLPYCVTDILKQTGQKCSHTIDPLGAFSLSCTKFLAKNPGMHWGANAVLDDEKPAKKNTKVKYECDECGACAWGKDTLHLICGDCDRTMARLG